jgi:hypothetical protein
MKTRRTFIVVVIVALIMIAAAIMIFINQLYTIHITKIDSILSMQEIQKEASLGVTKKPEQMDFYTACLNKTSTQDQKDQLNKLKKDFSMGWGYYKREALIIIGDLKKDQKRLTLAEAKKIVQANSDEATIVAQFTAIAGAPDFEGGSGISTTVYFLDDNRTEAVVITLSRVLYETFDSNGKRISVSPLLGTFTPTTTIPIAEATPAA